MSDLPRRVESVRILAEQNDWTVSVQHSQTEQGAIAMVFSRGPWRGYALWLVDDTGRVTFKNAVSLRVPPGPLKTLTRLKAWLADPGSVASINDKTDETEAVSA